ncbi:cobalt transporter [Almyronema epifaneia]|uniref:Cobalt transporter n=1 Tax=Almyronema epifaneia S1 TaxID=2991925 RepID=A0ABW6IJX2_9CYAN
MKRLPLMSSILALSLAVTTPAALAHVGHGDEFQAEGGVNRVLVNPDADALFGIQVNPIESAADGSGAVMIPVSALVEDNGRQLVFVEYEGFYEPVPVTTGESQGEMIEILEGVTFGEQLVTQGSLSLYAESRKTQTAETPASDVVTTEEGVISHAEADAQGIAHSHPPDGSFAESSDVAQAPEASTPASREFPWSIVVGISALAAVGAGVMTVLSGRKKKSAFSEGTYSNKKGGF